MYFHLESDPVHPTYYYYYHHYFCTIIITIFIIGIIITINTIIDITFITLVEYVGFPSSA